MLVVCLVEITLFETEVTRLITLILNIVITMNSSNLLKLKSVLFTNSFIANNVPIKTDISPTSVNRKKIAKNSLFQASWLDNWHGIKLLPKTK